MGALEVTPKGDEMRCSIQLQRQIYTRRIVHENALYKQEDSHHEKIYERI